MKKNNAISRNTNTKLPVWVKDISIRNMFLILGILYVVGIVVYSAIVASRRSLTSLEVVFLTVLGILVSTLISYFSGQKALRDEVTKGLRGEAEKALRRIIVISQSAGRIFQNVKVKMEDFANLSETKTKKSNELIYQYFYELANQIEDLIANIDASVEDWRDILPEKVGILDEQKRKIAEANERAIQERNELIKKYQKELEKYKKDDSKIKEIKEDLREELALKLGEFQAEIAKIKSQYAPISLGFGTAAPYVSGGRLSELMTLSDRIRLSGETGYSMKELLQGLEEPRLSERKPGEKSEENPED